MIPTLTVDNKIQYIPVAHTQTLPMAPAAPVMFLPPMVPATFPFQPPALPLMSFPSQTLPLNSLPIFYDGSSFTSMPQNLQVSNGEGHLVAPPGYTFVTMDVPSASVERSVSAEPAGEPDLLPVPSISETRSRSSSVVSEPEQTKEGETTVAIKTKPPQNKKFRHRSKQERIMEVHAKLKEEYTAKGLYAGDEEVLRGFDTVRVHVKTYKALNRIECPLNDVEKHPDVKILKIATPFSMKNKFQKKGFIVYLKLAHVNMVEIVQEIFSHYKEDFAKCDVALKKEDKQALDRQKALEKKELSLSGRTSSTLSTEFLSTTSFRSQGMDFNNWANMAA